MATSNTALQLARDLWKQVSGGNTPDLESCQQIVKELEKNIDRAQSHKFDTFHKTFVAAQKSFRLQKRKTDGKASESWESLSEYKFDINSEINRA